MRFFFAFLTTVESHRRFHFIARCLFYRVIKTYVKTNVASLKRRWRLREDGLGLISSITTEGRKEEREEKNNTKKKQEIIQIEFDYKLVDMRSMGKENWPRRRRRRSSTRSWFVNFLIFFSPFPDIIESVNGPKLLRCKTICSRTSTFNAPRLVHGRCPPPHDDALCRRTWTYSSETSNTWSEVSLCFPLFDSIRRVRPYEKIEIMKFLEFMSVYEHSTHQHSHRNIFVGHKEGQQQKLARGKNVLQFRNFNWNDFHSSSFEQNSERNLKFKLHISISDFPFTLCYLYSYACALVWLHRR